MASLYPDQLDNFAVNRTNATPNDPAQKDDHNDHADAINKIEAELGVAPSGSFATVRAKLDALMLTPPASTGLASVWDNALGRFIFKKITDAEMDTAAAMAVTKLSPGSPGQVLVTSAGPTVGWGSIVAIPTGVLLPFAGAAVSVPAGFLLCDGTEISRVTYATLFGVIGVAYGAPTGSTFNLPDFRGRVPVGLGQHAEVDTLGENDGVAVANRTPKHNTTVTTNPHNHGVNDPSHNHDIYYNFGGQGGSGGAQISSVPAYTFDSQNQFTGITIQNETVVASGGPGGTRPIDVTPYQVVNYIIKT